MQENGRGGYCYFVPRSKHEVMRRCSRGGDGKERLGGPWVGAGWVSRWEIQGRNSLPLGSVGQPETTEHREHRLGVGPRGGGPGASSRAGQSCTNPLPSLSRGVGLDGMQGPPVSGCEAQTFPSGLSGVWACEISGRSLCRESGEQLCTPVSIWGASACLWGPWVLACLHVLSLAPLWCECA